MGYFDQEAFYRFASTQRVVGFEKRRLSSGRETQWYVNWRKLDVQGMDCLSDFVVQFVQDLGLEPDCFYAVPEGANSLGLLSQYKWALSSSRYGPGSHVLPLGRGKKKDHGAPENRFFVQAPRGKTLLLEDVATTGSSLLQEIENLKTVPVSIIGVVTVTDRGERRVGGQSVEEVVEACRISYHTMSRGFRLVQDAWKKDRPNLVAEALLQEFREHYLPPLPVLE